MKDITGVQAGKKNEKGEDRNRKFEFFRGEGIWLSVVTCFMLFIFAPFELLFMNQNEFWFDAYLLAPIMLFVFGVACVCSILGFAILRKCGETIYRLGLAVYFVVFLSLYIQGNILTGSLPLLDGSNIDWSLYRKEYVQSCVLWIVVVLVVAIVYHKTKDRFFESMVRVVSICMTLMFCVTLLTLALSNHGFEKKLGLTVTDKNMFQMSEDQNLVILILDAVDARAMNALMEDNPDYQDIFTDFTYYRNTMGVYPATRNSVPYILSGEWFENEVEFREYEARAYADSPLLSDLEQKGWQIGLYEQELLANDEGKKRFENVIPGKRGVGSKLMMIKWQLQLTGFRYAPYCLKPYMFVNLNHLNRIKIPPEGETVYSSTNKSFYDRMQSAEIDLTDRKCFRFIHIAGGHPPFNLNENVEEIAAEDGSYEDNVKASLTITKAYLDKLKEAGVYDNSVIIVMADHGYSNIIGDYHEQQNPIFFVKGMEESHDFSVSEAPISYEDLQEAYVRLLNGAGSDQIFDWKEGDQRERRFLFYEGGEEDHMIEYMQPGHASDADAMYETGNVYDR